MATILEQGLKQVATDLAVLPKDTKGALVAVATTDGVRVGLVSRVGKHWQVSADLGYSTTTKTISGSATVVATW